MEADFVMDRFAETEEILGRLVGFNTVSDRSNKELTDFVCDYLTEWGIGYEIFHDQPAEKVAILATVGPMIDGGVVLSGHTDVVPIDGQIWTSDPFALRRDGDRLVGRGAVDMKGFCATALSMLPRFKHLNLARPMHLLLSYDEETSGIGSLGLIERFGRSFSKPSHAIIGEPTEMGVVIAHKGVAAYQTTIKGIAAHASRPDDGVNAIDFANEAISFLHAAERDLNDARFRDHRFDPSHTTVHIGLIHGGTATNIVPSECAFGWEVRAVPGVDGNTVIAKLDAWAAEQLAANYSDRAAVELTTKTTCALPPLATDESNEIVSLAMRLAQQDKACAVAYATEAGHFQHAGIAAVVCGPGSISQAHRPDEYITVNDLRRYENFLERVAESLIPQ
jgi:acetylornithine deacetylase